ncbi:MAG: hypothetical protein K940chlam8_00804 [Chlamydiae bacterium]|nr:hypothetical protein [Chlamydiota bacterium]
MDYGFGMAGILMILWWGWYLIFTVIVVVKLCQIAKYLKK